MTDHALLHPVVDETHRLDTGVQAQMERTLGAPFGDVVVHTGTASAALAEGQHAAAFTVGRHVVFGPGRYDPSSVRGRTLIAHELTHVVQQRRGGGDPDLGLHRPALAVATHTTHGEGHGTTAARAALGSLAPVAGSTSVSMARQDKDDDGWTTWLAVKARDTVKRGIGAVEGVADVGAGLIETAVWVPSKLSEAKDAAVDAIGRKLDIDRDTLRVIKAVDTYKVAHSVAEDAGLVDEETGAIVLIPSVTRAADWLERRVDEVPAFEGLPAEEDFFTEREIAQLKATLGAEVALAAIGVEEVQIVLKVLSGIGAGKAAFDAAQRSKDPQGFLHDLAFWVALAQAVLFLLGLKATTAGCPVPGLMEALIPREDETHGSTEEVSRGASGASDQDGRRSAA